MEVDSSRFDVGGKEDENEEDEVERVRAMFSRLGIWRGSSEEVICDPTVPEAPTMAMEVMWFGGEGEHGDVLPYLDDVLESWQIVSINSC